MKQLVQDVTRLNPPAMLDPIMSTLGAYYQQPVCLPPLDPDPDTNGKPADHLIVVMKPINTLNNKPGRNFREVKVRLLTKSGLIKFKSWVQEQNWKEVLDEPSVDKKAEKLHNMVLDKLDEFCPEKTRMISDDDKPWFSEQLKRLARKKARLFRKSRSSKKYKRIQAIYKEKKSEAKKNFKKNMIDDVITARS